MFSIMMTMKTVLEIRKNTVRYHVVIVKPGKNYGFGKMMGRTDVCLSRQCGNDGGVL